VDSRIQLRFQVL